MDNVATVNALYKAIESGEPNKVAGHIADDLEWWFHGPQNCHHMMKMLTGKSLPEKAFKFEPRSVDAIDDYVIVEGWEGQQAYWVHVWTLKDGIITQFREYFNTWLTVADLRRRPAADSIAASGGGCFSRSSTLWQSHPRDLAKRSLPGLMFAI